MDRPSTSNVYKLSPRLDLDARLARHVPDLVPAASLISVACYLRDTGAA